jgi:phosphatidylserine/phosphatidylglycerophosphate/cardiolipin synthase-like enzyme
VVAAGDGRLGTHAKVLVADGRAVVGSHNWTDDAFFANAEDSVLLAGPVVDILASEHADLWQRGRGLPRAAS